MRQYKPLTMMKIRNLVFDKECGKEFAARVRGYEQKRGKVKKRWDEMPIREAYSAPGLMHKTQKQKIKLNKTDLKWCTSPRKYPSCKNERIGDTSCSRTCWFKVHWPFAG